MPLPGMPGAMPGGMPGMGPLGPMAPGLASPETRGTGMGPESRTLVASPVADRLAGPLMHMQRMEVGRRAALVLRQTMQTLARSLQDTNPRGARDLEQMAAKLLTLFPPLRPPGGPAGVEGLARNLPPVSGGLLPMPPPPVPGVAALSGLTGGP